MTFWLYVLFSILLKCNFSHINFVHYLVVKVPILSSIKVDDIEIGLPLRQICYYSPPERGGSLLDLDKSMSFARTGLQKDGM